METLKQKINLLIVDDEQEILHMLDKYLSKNESLNITTYNDSVEGLKFAKENDIDVILLDIMMPNIDGMEFLEEIKRVKNHVKVIMMTAFSSLDRVLETHRIGASGYIMKPFDSLKALNEKIMEIINEE